MSDLIAPVSQNSDGTYSLNISESSQESSEERKVGSELDKEDFLLLLVTQMQYQDPLDPADNTEYVAQLAQFSELEQMTNLNTTMSNNSAYSLVGQEVLVRQTSSTGEIQEIQGTVQKVTIKNGDAYVTIDGSDYAYDDIVQVIDKDYLISTYAPSVMQQSLLFHHGDPQDVKVSGVDLGSEGYQASSFAVVLVNASNQSEQTAIDTKYLSYKDGVLTIDRDAFADTQAGNYILAFVFDDANQTVDYSNVTLEVKGIVQAAESTASGDTSDTTDAAADGSSSDAADDTSGESTTTV
jgi:flagellar basal-body rod modification protein FlgD